MADIDSIISGVSGNTRADFSGLGNLLGAYWEGLDQRQKNEERNVFRPGFPKNPDGSPNYAEAAKKLYQLGNIEKGTGMSNLDLARQQLALGQEASRALGSVESGAGSPPINIPTLPPSTSRNASVVVAPPTLNAKPVQGMQTAPQGGYRGGDAPGSIVGLVSSAGVPDELAGPIIQQVSAITRTDPNAPIRPDIAPRVQQIVQAAVQRMRGPAQAAPAPQPMAPQPQPATFAQRFVGDTRGSAPTDIDPNVQQRAAQYTQIMSNPALPQPVRDAAKVRLEALQKNSELTPAQKELAQAQRYGFQGGPLELAAKKSADEAQIKERSEVMKDAVKTKIDGIAKGKEIADMAYEGLNITKDLKDQLDAKSGIFSGQFADKQLKFAKIAQLVGLSGADYERAVTNTESFRALVGQKVARLVKSFGSGTSITNQDREYAEKMAAGDITLNEQSIRRILDITERYSRLSIIKHNEGVDSLIKARPELASMRDSFVSKLDGVPVKTPAEARGLPKGTKIVLPDGYLGTVP